MSEEVKNIGIGYSAWDDSGTRTKVGIGMVGRGFMGKAHTNAYKKIGYLFESNNEPELAAIAASSLKNAEAAAARYGYKKAYGDWHELILDPDVQVVDNVGVDRIHEEPCIAAAEAGKAVICEKPLARGREPAKRMLDAVKKAGVKNAVCFNYRFMPAVRLAYELLQKGAVGDIMHFYGRYHQSYGLPPEAPVESVWYQNMTGNTQGLCTHLIDQARFLVGEIATINGYARKNPVRRPSLIKNGELVEVPYDDEAAALIEFENGATGTLENSSMRYGKWNELYWEIYGTKGMIAFNLEDVCYLTADIRNPDFPELNGRQRVSVTQPSHPFMNIWWPAGHNTGWEHGHINMLAHFLDCVVNNKEVGPLGADFEDGYRTAVILDTLYQSSLEGRKQDIVF